MRNAGPCAQCRCEVHIPDELYEAAKRSSSIGFYCGYGHRLVFPQGESETDKLRRERDILTQQQARLEDEKRAALATANAQLERAKRAESALKRHRKRAAGGACPCCNRTFQDMARHMKTKHPLFVKQNGNVIPLGKATA